MAGTAPIILHFSLSPPFPFKSSRSRRRVWAPSSSSSLFLLPSASSVSFKMDQQQQQQIGRRKLMEFPYLSAPHRDLMVEIVTAMETRLGSQLLPCSLPSDVEYYQNENGTSQGTLYVRRGADSSPIDFILGSWLHCELPTGGALNITGLSAYLNASTNAPHFLIELIQSSPTSLVLILDMPPRKDLVINPDYLKTFYEDTELEKQRQLLEKMPEVKPYFSSSLYIRCVVSPTAILVRIDTEASGQKRLDEIVEYDVSPIAKGVLEIWLNCCATVVREVGETDGVSLKERDRAFKSNTIEIDLGSNLPKLFGPEIASRVLGAMREVYNK